jgi:hypothetical protein
MLDLIRKELGPKLSQGESITAEAPPRWSTYKAPKPVAVVNVNNGQDVAYTVGFRAFGRCLVNAYFLRLRSVTTTTFQSSPRMEEVDGLNFRKQGIS